MMVGPGTPKPVPLLVMYVTGVPLYLPWLASMGPGERAAPVPQDSRVGARREGSVIITAIWDKSRGCNKVQPSPWHGGYTHRGTTHHKTSSDLALLLVDRTNSPGSLEGARIATAAKIRLAREEVHHQLLHDDLLVHVHLTKLVRVSLPPETTPSCKRMTTIPDSRGPDMMLMPIQSCNPGDVN
jgi:hypothetical protein